MIEFSYDDGGRQAAGFKGRAGDCVTRAIAIAAQRPYREVYEALRERNQAFARRGRSAAARQVASRGATPRQGVHRAVFHPYLLEIGFEWVSAMAPGQVERTHLRADELPMGRLVVRLSRHLAAVVDGVLHDTEDCSRGGTRTVYGYYRRSRQAVSPVSQ